MNCPQCESTEWLGTTGLQAASDGFVRCSNGHKLTNDEFNARSAAFDNGDLDVEPEPVPAPPAPLAVVPEPEPDNEPGEPETGEEPEPEADDEPELAHPAILDIKKA